MVFNNTGFLYLDRNSDPRDVARYRERSHSHTCTHTNSTDSHAQYTQKHTGNCNLIHEPLWSLHRLTCSVLHPVTFIPAHKALDAPSLLNTLNWMYPAMNSPENKRQETAFKESARNYCQPRFYGVRFRIYTLKYQTYWGSFTYSHP